MKTQLKKGTLDMCVLAVLAGGDSYAYELVSTLSETMEISEGTIYPLMRRLQAEAWVSTYFVESTSGPPRRVLLANGCGTQQPRGNGGRNGAVLSMKSTVCWSCPACFQEQGNSDDAGRIHPALRYELRNLPKQAVDEIIADYREYIGDALAAGRSEAEVVAALGDPVKLARELKAQASFRQWETRRSFGNPDARGRVDCGARPAAVVAADSVHVLSAAADRRFMPCRVRLP